MLFLLIIFLVVLILISGFFSGSETALFSLSAMKVKMFKKERHGKGRLVAQLLGSPKDLLVTIILINVIVNILIQNVVSNLFGDGSWLLNVGIPLILVLVFGEFIPKSLGIANNQRIAPIVAPILAGVAWVLSPIRKFFTSITQVVASVMFFFLKREREISVDELQHVLKSSKQIGMLNLDEAELVDGYLQLEGATVKEFLRPRDEALFFDIDDPLERLLHLFVDQECTRIPVCKGDFDHVLGIMTARAFFLYRAKIQTSSDLKSFLEKPFYVPESLSAKNLIEQMDEKEESFAIVVDEYGATSGLISFEDLVEVVVGEIVDRRDEKSLFTRSGSDVIIASGKLELTEFEEVFGIPLKSSTAMVTIGGWLTEQLGDIPKAGVKFSTKQFLFHVLTADQTRVKRIYIRRLKRGSGG